MSEFFDTRFGRKIKDSFRKTKKQYDEQSIYEVMKKIDRNLRKGDQLYLDGLHKDHLEVFDSQGKLKRVLNLDGIPNIEKRKQAGTRFIKIK